MPRPDSAPLFGKLLDDKGGFFSIRSERGEGLVNQRYLQSTNILATQVDCGDGSFEIIDFCPRFHRDSVTERPPAIIRIITPLRGEPEIRIACRPVAGWSRKALAPEQNENVIRFRASEGSAFLSASEHLDEIRQEAPFKLTKTTFLALSWNNPVTENLPDYCQDALDRTSEYWRTWVKHCSIPFELQKETIRSALALKLHCYDETGAILAAPTTSLPEEFGGERNWDYRLCWLRDSYFTLSAFHRLGHFEEMEGFLKYLLELFDNEREHMKPVYRIDGTSPIPETEHPEWSGYRGSKPVRSNNQAALHVQNDVFGELVLALAPIYFDERFHHLRTPRHEKLMARLAHFCESTISQPDAGLWELRNGWQDHSYTNLMCWAGLDRIHALKSRGLFSEISVEVEKARDRARLAVIAAVKDGSVRNGPTDASFNAALFQLPVLRFPEASLNQETMFSSAKGLAVTQDFREQPFFYRYHRPDDFGTPQSAFLICSFWWVQALAANGHQAEAKEALYKVMRAANPLGLFSEHFDPSTSTQLGNFPQAYSHVGQLVAAFSVSPPWDSVL